MIQVNLLKEILILNNYNYLSLKLNKDLRIDMESICLQFFIGIITNEDIDVDQELQVNHNEILGIVQI